MKTSPKPPSFDVPDVPKEDDSLREKRNRRYAELQARCLELERLCRLESGRVRPEAVRVPTGLRRLSSAC